MIYEPYYDDDDDDDDNKDTDTETDDHDDDDYDNDNDNGNDNAFIRSLLFPSWANSANPFTTRPHDSPCEVCLQDDQILSSSGRCGCLCQVWCLQVTTPHANIASAIAPPGINYSPRASRKATLVTVSSSANTLSIPF